MAQVVRRSSTMIAMSARTGLALACCAALVACSGTEAPDRAVRQLPFDDPTDTTPADPAAPTSPAADATASTITVAPARAPSPTGPDAPAVDVDVDEVLTSYDRALTALVGRPEAAIDPADPIRREWDRVVAPGSSLSEELLEQVRRRGIDQGIVVVPDASGFAYRHRVLTVGSATADSVSFTWCGHSPGIGVHAATGEVRDDAVAHARGTGMLRRTDTRWVLESLDELELDVLGAGAPDPCPAEVDQVRRSGGRP